MKPFQSAEGQPPRARAGKRAGREGYVSLLAVTFAFGLATFGTVMAISLRFYVRAAVGQERAIVDRISLDSASARFLGRLSDGGEQPIASWTAPVLEINGRTITLEVSLPEGKHDLAMDAPEVLAKGLEKTGLPNGLAELANDQTRGLAEISHLAGLTAASEDCLRRQFTLGRAPEAMEPLAATGSQSTLTRRVMPGDQIDMRVAIRRTARTEVLWQRARFIGIGSGWKTHDDRVLRVNAVAKC